MDERTTQLSELLRQAAETHHQVFAITDGDDPDWATWYADWLANLSRLGDPGRYQTRSKRADLLVGRP